MEVKFKYIREEIDIRVESLVNQVHEMGNRLKGKVEESEKEALKLTVKVTKLNSSLYFVLSILKFN